MHNPKYWRTIHTLQSDGETMSVGVLLLLVFFSIDREKEEETDSSDSSKKKERTKSFRRECAGGLWLSLRITPFTDDMRKRPYFILAWTL